MSDVKDFKKIVEEQEAFLNRLKAQFDEQSALMARMVADAEKAGIDLSRRPKLEAMSEEERLYCLEFDRQLNEINRLLAPAAPQKAKLPKMGRRSMI